MQRFPGPYYEDGIKDSRSYIQICLEQRLSCDIGLYDAQGFRVFEFTVIKKTTKQPTPQNKNNNPPKKTKTKQTQSNTKTVEGYILSKRFLPHVNLVRLLGISWSVESIPLTLHSSPFFCSLLCSWEGTQKWALAHFDHIVTSESNNKVSTIGKEKNITFQERVILLANPHQSHLYCLFAFWKQHFHVASIPLQQGCNNLQVSLSL